MIEKFIRSIFRFILHNRKIPLNFEELRKNAIVFSPHQDDETLGCGGTICLKRNLNADIKIVFMTDGSNSHTGLIGKEKLRSIRAAEAIAATKKLGVGSRNLIFLGYDDGKLSENRKSALNSIKDIIIREKPCQIFTPCLDEPAVDHYTTTKFVMDAIDDLKYQTIVYEYPVWLWNQWPWVKPSSFETKWYKLLKPYAKSILKCSSIFQLNYGISIKDIIDVKKNALHKYRSQMTRYESNQAWTILSDVGNGSFLNCFFTDYELFRKIR